MLSPAPVEQLGLLRSAPWQRNCSHYQPWSSAKQNPPLPYRYLPVMLLSRKSLREIPGVPKRRSITLLRRTSACTSLLLSRTRTWSRNSCSDGTDSHLGLSWSSIWTNITCSNCSEKSVEKGQHSARPPLATLPAPRLTVVQGLSASELMYLHARKWMWSLRVRRAILFSSPVSQP